MNVIVTAGAAHFDHIHHVLCVRVLLLPQVEHFEFLPHRWIMPSRLNIAERTKWLLCLTVFLRVSEALVLLDLCQSRFFFHTELHIVQSFVWKSDQVWCYGQGKLSKRDLAIRLVAQSAQNRIHILFQNLLLKLEQEILNVLKVKEAKVALVNHAKNWNCIEFLHSLKCFLLYFDLDMVMNFLFKQSGQFKLNIGLQSVISTDLVILSLTDFCSQCNVIHRKHQLQETET